MRRRVTDDTGPHLPRADGHVTPGASLRPRVSGPALSLVRTRARGGCGRGAYRGAEVSVVRLGNEDGEFVTDPILIVAKRRNLGCVKSNGSLPTDVVVSVGDLRGPCRHPQIELKRLGDGMADVFCLGCAAT